jgi:hypothetical protein
MLADPGLVIVKPIEMDQEIHIAVEGEQRVFGQWMKRSEKNARPQKSLGHGIALSRRFVDVAQEANRLKAARAIILGFWALALKSPVIALPTGHWGTALRQPRHRVPNVTLARHRWLIVHEIEGSRPLAAACPNDRL